MAVQAFREGLNRREAASVGQIRRLYDATFDQFEREIAKLEARIASAEEAGEEPAATWAWARERLLTLSAQLQGELEELAPQGARVTADGQGQMALYAEGEAPRLLRAAGVETAWNRLPVATLEAFAGMSQGGTPVEALFATFARETGTDLLVAIGAALARGENPKAVARRLAGLSGQGRARCEAITRTEMHRAAREASRASYAANADVVSGYTRRSARDSRVCVACWALDGRRYDTGEVMHNHVQCRCCMLPLVDGLEYGDDGETTFARLPESEQAEVLGPARMAQYQDGVPLSEMVELFVGDWGPEVRVKPVTGRNAPAAGVLEL